MGVKVLDNPVSSKAGGQKQQLLMADMTEIIKNRIQYCELTDFPYSDKTSISSIMDYIVHPIAELFKLDAGVYPTGYHKHWGFPQWQPPIIMRRVKESDGTHMYVTFNIAAWNREIEEAKKGK